MKWPFFKNKTPAAGCFELFTRKTGLKIPKSAVCWSKFSSRAVSPPQEEVLATSLYRRQKFKPLKTQQELRHNLHGARFPNPYLCHG